MKKKILLLLAAAFVMSLHGAHAEPFHVLENRELKILFESPLESAAKEVANLYPFTRVELEKNLGWDLNVKPIVLLIRDRDRFQYIAGNPLIVGLAVSDSNMIVIDYSKMTRHPFSIRNTLKHEMCHLLLHHHIPERALPRWLDEGVCQWVSDWIGDIMHQKPSCLNRAAIRGSFLSLRSLHHRFPSDKEAMLLAYEQSKSFVAHIIAQFGKEGILSVLEHMKKGENVEEAFLSALSTPLEELELQWRQAVRTKMSWLTHLSCYLYEILFALMAMMTIYAFIKIIAKKKAYMAEDPEDILLS